MPVNSDAKLYEALSLLASDRQRLIAALSAMTAALQ